MKSFEGSTVRHGTSSGWSKHQKLNEDPCLPCYLAKQEYDKRQRSTDRQTRKSRLYSKAQQKALQRIAREFPALYSRYYQEYKTQIFTEAGIEE